MKVGIVREIKNSENRVAIIPQNVPEFTAPDIRYTSRRVQDWVPATAMKNMLKPELS